MTASRKGRIVDYAFFDSIPLFSTARFPETVKNNPNRILKLYLYWIQFKYWQ